MALKESNGVSVCNRLKVDEEVESPGDTNDTTVENKENEPQKEEMGERTIEGNSKVGVGTNGIDSDEQKSVEKESGVLVEQNCEAKPSTSGSSTSEDVTSESDSTSEDDDYPDLPMTYDEKKSLSDSVNLLSGDEIGGIVEIYSFQYEVDPMADELEIDFNELSAFTLREMERYCKLCFLKLQLSYMKEQIDVLKELNPLHVGDEDEGESDEDEDEDESDYEDEENEE